MEVWMMEQVLAPRVKDTEEADLSPKVFRIGSNLQESCGASPKQQGIKQLLIVKDKRRKCMGKRKDEMHIGNREKFPLTSG
jgi:hypothetical protein